MAYVSEGLQLYEMVHRNIYIAVHQRVASSFRSGRVLLAGTSPPTSTTRSVASA